eukprot:COSAG01_NODE_4629_length_4863_cov_4.778967_3_plen_36_part_00
MAVGSGDHKHGIVQATRAQVAKELLVKRLPELMMP